MTPSAHNAVIFGGLGFIGTNLALRLSDLGWNVTVVDPVSPESLGVADRLGALGQQVRVLCCGMEESRRVKEAVMDADVAFDVAGRTGHLASMEDPLGDLNSNLVAHLKYLEMARDVRPRLPLVLASTRQVLGSPAGGVINDSLAPQPVDANGVSKVALESYLKVFGSVWKMPSVVVRLPNVFGPHMRVVDSANGVIGGWVGQALRDGRLMLYDGGQTRRNVLFVDDAVDAILASCDLVHASAPTFLIGGEELSLHDIAFAIADLTGAEVLMQQMPPQLRSIAVGSVIIDDSRFREQANWSPRVGFAEGLRQSLSFYEEREHLYAR